MHDPVDVARSRAPVDVARLRAQVLGPDGWRSVDVVPETGSTNDDLVAAAAERDVEGAVLVAEHQLGGRGRLGRSWVAPAGSGLTFSVAVRPSLPASRLGWLPLLAGVAVADALVDTVVDAAQAPVRLKWPNDVVVVGEGSDRKLAGVLAERVQDLVVVGIGINVTLAADELPVPEATSLALEGAVGLDRTSLLVAVLRSLAAWVGRPAAGTEADGRAAYLARCATVGRDVVVELPGGSRTSGRAVDVDELGRLVVEGADGRTAIAAGDVQHVR